MHAQEWWDNDTAPSPQGGQSAYPTGSQSPHRTQLQLPTEAKGSKCPHSHPTLDLAFPGTTPFLSRALLLLTPKLRKPPLGIEQGVWKPSPGSLRAEEG